MLYGYPNAVNAAGHVEDLDNPMPGLGAVLPHVVNASEQSGGGGGFRTQGTGGGNPPGGSVSIALTQGSGYHPVSLNTASPFAGGHRAFVARTVFQSNKQGARETPAWDTTLSGLGAVRAHSVNAYKTIAGGGFTVEGVGGGNPPGGTVAIAVTQGPVSHTVGYNASPVTTKYGVKQFVARSVYQESKQGARVAQGQATSPMGARKTASFPVGGLFGPGDIQPIGIDPGLSGLSANFFSQVGSFLNRTVAIPIQRAAIPFYRPSAILPALKTNLTPVARVGGAVVVGVAAGAAAGMIGGPAGMLMGAIGGGTYGLAKGIYGVTSNAPEGRTLYQTALPAAIIGASVGAVEAVGNGYAGFAPAAVPAPVASAPIGAPAAGLNLVQTTAPFGVVSPGAFTAGVPIAGASAFTAPAAAATPGVIGAGGAALPGLDLISTTAPVQAGFMAPSAVPSGSTSFLSTQAAGGGALIPGGGVAPASIGSVTTGLQTSPAALASPLTAPVTTPGSAGFLSGGLTTALKTGLDTAAAAGILKMLSPSPAAPSGPTPLPSLPPPPAGVDAGAQVQPQQAVGPQIVPVGGGGGDSGAAPAADTSLLSSPTGLIIGVIGLGAAYMLLAPKHKGAHA